MKTRSLLGPGGTGTFSSVVIDAGGTLDLYNTADKTTNYERLRASFTANIATIFTQNGGTGILRALRLGTSARFIEISATGADTNGISAYPIVGNSSGTQVGFYVAPTINQSGTAGYTALDINAQETSTGSGTKLLQRWAVGGVARAQINNAGSFSAEIFTAATSLGLSSASVGAGQDVTLQRDAADTLALRRSTSAQAFRVYNTYTDASNYERLSSFWSGGVLYLHAESAGTGTARPLSVGTQGAAALNFTTGNSIRWIVNSSGTFLANADNSYDIGASGANRPRNVYVAQYLTANIARTPGILVAALPAAGTAGNGARAFVTDANATAYASVVAGGGANTVPVYSDGTNWRIG